MKGMGLVTEKYAKYQPLGTGMKFRAHPLGIGIAHVQMRKLKELNARRTKYVEEVEAGLGEILGVKPVKVYEGVVPGRFYGFPIIHIPEEQDGLATAAFVDALQKESLPAHPSGYLLLHRLPIFAEGFDMYTRDRDPLCGDYPGYKEGGFPVTEEMLEHLVFLPVLSDPVPDAAERILEAVNKVAKYANKLASIS